MAMGLYQPRRRVIAACLALSTCLAPVAAAGETLTQTLADAYRHAGLLDRNRATLRAADEDVAQAVATLRPTVTYALGRSYRGGPAVAASTISTSLSLTAQMTLYDFGRNQLGVEAAKEAVLATRQLLVSVEQGVLFDAVSAYFDVREGGETVSLRENNVRLITQELRAAEDRFDVGEVTRTDVALAQARLAGARSGLATAQGTLAIAAAAFRDAVGRRPGVLTQPRSTPRVPSTVPDAIAIARRTHPDILRVQHQIRAAELNIERARKALYPTLSGSASSSFDLANDGQRTDSLSVTLGGTVSAGGQLNSIIRQAQAALDQARAVLHITRHTVEEQVETAYAQLAVARANIAASDEQIRAATVAFRGVREEATLGARTTLDVLDAEQELLDARANRVTAVAAEFRAAYGVLASIGRLTAKDLQLPVQLYDPAAYYNLVKDAPKYTPNSAQGRALERVLESIGSN